MPNPPYPSQTWPDGAVPTVDQLRAWIRAHDDEHDARVAADMILGMYADAGRLVADLRAQVAAVDAVLAELDDDQRAAMYEAVRVARARREGE